MGNIHVQLWRDKHFTPELYPAQKVGPPACMGLPRLLFWGGGGVKALGAGHCLTHQSSEYNEVMQ